MDYPERKKIVVASCDGCPFYGKCDPWLSLTSKQRVSLALSNNSKGFILKGCPLPYGENDEQPFDMSLIKPE